MKVETVEDLRTARATHSYLDATSATHDVATHVSCYAARVKDLKAISVATREARSAAFITFADCATTDCRETVTDAAWNAYTAAATASHKAAKAYHSAIADKTTIF